MKAPRFWMVVPALLVAGVVGMAYAKLPAPTDEQKAKAAEAKGKAAEAAKKAAAALAKAQDRAVDNYKRGKGTRTAASAAPKKSKMK